jgi:hypothetical protein
VIATGVASGAPKRRARTSALLANRVSESGTANMSAGEVLAVGRALPVVPGVTGLERKDPGVRMQLLPSAPGGRHDARGG